MPPKKKTQKRAAEPKKTAAFEGVRSRPRTGSGKPGQARRTGGQAQDRSGSASRKRPDGGKPRGAVQRQNTGSSPAGEQPIDPRSDPEVMFRLLSDKISTTVEKAAMKAGASAAQKVSSQLTAELDAAIAGAQSTAGKMGALVQQAVQTAVDEALRTAVLNATRVREEHLAQLALIDRTAQTTRDLASVQLRIDAEMRRSGLTRVTDPDPDAFNLTNPAEHPDSTVYEVLAPAYVDEGNSRIVQRGEMRRTPAGLQAEEGSGR
ncbi:hypothetical protein [Streptomyces sp. NPDC057496]|uniref:hypothetical protein n=1 Tax=Streptomyces sp. NPDC057496 TaxID=3346149 RepID=UPI0036C32BB6